jgi:hypothetical protein
MATGDMRACLIVLWCLLLAAAVTAQNRVATVTLEDGRVLHGTVLQLDVDHMTIECSGKVQHLLASQIRRCRFLKTDDVPGEIDGGGRGDEPERPAAQTAPAPTPAAGATSLRRQRLLAINTKYPWLAPLEPAQWISLGITLMAMVSFAVHLAAKTCGADRPRFVVGVASAFVVVCGSLLQLCFVPITGINVLAMVVGNGVVVALMFRLLYHLAMPQAILGLFVLLAEFGLAFGVLEGIDMTLRMVGGEFTTS